METLAEYLSKENLSTVWKYSKVLAFAAVGYILGGLVDAVIFQGSINPYLTPFNYIFAGIFGVYMLKDFSRKDEYLIGGLVAVFLGLVLPYAGWGVIIGAYFLWKFQKLQRQQKSNNTSSMTDLWQRLSSIGKNKAAGYFSAGLAIVYVFLLSVSLAIWKKPLSGGVIALIYPLGLLSTYNKTIIRGERLSRFQWLLWIILIIFASGIAQGILLLLS